MEMERVPAAGYDIKGLPVCGFDRKHLLRNVKVLMKLWKSIRLANQILKDFKPDIAIGVGGYASGPMLKAAQKKGIPTLLQEQNSYKNGARYAMMGANPEKEHKIMFENGTFAVLGPDGKQVQCDVLFTYDCEDNGRSYVVFTTGEGAQQRLFANRYDTREDGQLALLALENEQEYAIIKHCFEELKAKLAEQTAAEQAAQAAAQEGEPEA